MTNINIKKEIERIQNLPQIKAQRKATPEDAKKAFQFLKAIDGANYYTRRIKQEASKLDAQTVTNYDGHKIVTIGKAKIKFQVSRAGVKIRCNRVASEILKDIFTIEYHPNWNMQFAILDATPEAVLAQFNQ